MSFSVNFPLFCIVGSLLTAVVSSVLGDRWARRVCMAMVSVVAVLNGVLLGYLTGLGRSVSYTMGHYPHPWGNELTLDSLEALVSVVFSLVLLLCLLGGKAQLQRDLGDRKRNLYYVMAALVQTSLLALVYTNDVFTGYVFIEICTIASCGLLMIRQIGRTTLASVRYMIFSLIGSGLFMLGVVFLYNITGHLLMPELKQTLADLWQSGLYRAPLLTGMSLITIGLAIKSGLFPFHFWMPDTYGYATPSSAGILSGLVSKGYIFLLLKLIFRAFGTQVFYGAGIHHILYLLGVIGMVVGSVSAIREDDIFRMVAYSSAAQIGYIYMGIGISPDLGVTAAVYHILTHAITKPALFLASAQLTDGAGGSKRFRELQGAAYSNWVAGLGFSVGALSMIGLPFTMGLIAKYLFARAAFQSELKMIPTLVVLGISTVLNTLYFARTILRLYNRPKRKLAKPCPVRRQIPYAVSALVLSGMNLLLGIVAQPLISMIEQGLKQF